MMPNDCKSNQVRQIDAAAVQSKNDVYSAADPCFLKFKSDDSMITDKMLMINFEQYYIEDCNVILEIYYGTAAVGQPNVSRTILAYFSFQKFPWRSEDMSVHRKYYAHQIHEWVSCMFEA